MQRRLIFLEGEEVAEVASSFLEEPEVLQEPALLVRTAGLMTARLVLHSRGPETQDMMPTFKDTKHDFSNMSY
tara:strand:+ start:2141 stop:2359 length:219 start_codon:yes stop_codon:yes gene_type:complete